jgi:hypothetical protein
MVFSGQKVLALEPYPSGEVVLITVSDAHTYLTEGVLSHNKSPIVTPPPPPVPPSSGGTTPGGTTPGGNQIPMGDGSYRPGVDDTVLTGGTPSGGIATLVGRGGGGEGGVRPPSMASRPAEIQAMISNLARDQRIRDMRALTELPSSMSFAEGGAVMEDDDIPPEIRDRQRAVTQMLANRASMLQSAQSQSMPSQQLPQQGMVPPVAPSMPMPANAPVGMMPPGQPLMPQVPQGPVSFGIPQQQGMGPQPSPMQTGIMGAPQLRGGF